MSEQAATSSANVEVVIVAYNPGDLLLDAVRSAAEQAGEDRVWVMDAESTDGSVDRMAARYPGTHVMRVPNAGFAASNNRGIEATHGEWVLLLNPDAVLAKGALAAMLTRARTDERIAVVGPRVLTPDGRVQEGSFGTYPTLFRRTGTAIARVSRRLTGRASGEPTMPAHATDVDWVTGACMLVRRCAIDVVGGLDEGFFLYFEDVEWCHRFFDRGYRIVLEPAAACTHHVGGSGAPVGVVARAYRESFYRYCDIYGLWGLKLAGRIGSSLRARAGGRV